MSRRLKLSISTGCVMEEVIRSMIIVCAIERAGLTSHHVIRLCVFSFGSCNPGGQTCPFHEVQPSRCPSWELVFLVLHVRLLPWPLGALRLLASRCILQGVNFKSSRAGSPSWCVLV